MKRPKTGKIDMVIINFFFMLCFVIIINQLKLDVKAKFSQSSHNMYFYTKHKLCQFRIFLIKICKI